MSAPATKAVCRKFIILDDGQDFSSDSTRFRVISYNILAQVYVKSSYFPHSPSSCLKWKARSQAILTDLRSLNADFFCIQELDEYDSFYRSTMESLGYSSIYVQRTGQKRDGCGIFYKNESAELVLHEEIHYNDLVPSAHYSNSSSKVENSKNEEAMTSIGTTIEGGNKFLSDLKKKTGDGGVDDHGDHNDPQVRLKRDCVGILAAFKLTNSSQHLVIVANTHIYWDPEWVDVKLAQVKYLLLRLTQFKEAVSNKFSSAPSVLIAGDFNSTPGDQVYQHLVSGAAPCKLLSLYGTNGGEPPFTNCTPGFTGTLDYIFLSTDGFLKPVSLLQLPEPESEDTVGGLPNLHHPSDHLPIGGDFVVHMAPSSPAESSDLIRDLGRLKIEERSS